MIIMREKNFHIFPVIFLSLNMFSCSCTRMKEEVKSFYHLRASQLVGFFINKNNMNNLEKKVVVIRL